ncbi:MAG: hypothetical protein ACREN4_00200 [Candidatus Dormibacteria bacterium]
MVNQPDVLLADEPVPDLDQTTRAEIADLIRELWERIRWPSHWSPTTTASPHRLSRDSG